MSNIRLLIADTLHNSEKISLKKDDAHYLVNVMKVRHADVIKAYNERDGEWFCKMELENKRNIFLIPFEKTDNSLRKSKVILAFALLKRQNNSLIIQKATELNVREIYPLITDRTIVKNINIDKLNIVAKEASEQCGRLDIPKIHNILDIGKLLNMAKNKNFIICHNCSDAISILDLREKIDYNEDTILLIGPEGGLSSEEIDMFEHLNITFVKLGKYTLRAETAIIAAIFTIQNLY